MAETYIDLHSSAAAPAVDQDTEICTRPCCAQSKQVPLHESFSIPRSLAVGMQPSPSPATSDPWYPSTTHRQQPPCPDDHDTFTTSLSGDQAVSRSTLSSNIPTGLSRTVLFRQSLPTFARQSWNSQTSYLTSSFSVAATSDSPSPNLTVPSCTLRSSASTSALHHIFNAPHCSSPFHTSFDSCLSVRLPAVAPASITLVRGTPAASSLQPRSSSLRYSAPMAANMSSHTSAHVHTFPPTLAELKAKHRIRDVQMIHFDHHGPTKSNRSRSIDKPYSHSAISNAALGTLSATSITTLETLSATSITTFSRSSGRESRSRDATSSPNSAHCNHLQQAKGMAHTKKETASFSTPALSAPCHLSTPHPSSDSSSVHSSVSAPCHLSTPHPSSDNSSVHSSGLDSTTEFISSQKDHGQSAPCIKSEHNPNTRHLPSTSSSSQSISCSPDRYHEGTHVKSSNAVLTYKGRGAPGRARQRQHLRAAKGLLSHVSVDATSDSPELIRQQPPGSFHRANEGMKSEGLFQQQHIPSSHEMLSKSLPCSPSAYRGRFNEGRRAEAGQFSEGHSSGLLCPSCQKLAGMQRHQHQAIPSSSSHLTPLHMEKQMSTVSRKILFQHPVIQRQFQSSQATATQQRLLRSKLPALLVAGEASSYKNMVAAETINGDVISRPQLVSRGCDTLSSLKSSAAVGTSAVHHRNRGGRAVMTAALPEACSSTGRAMQVGPFGVMTAADCCIAVSSPVKAVTKESNVCMMKTMASATASGFVDSNTRSSVSRARQILDFHDFVTRSVVNKNQDAEIKDRDVTSEDTDRDRDVASKDTDGDRDVASEQADSTESESRTALKSDESLFTGLE